MRGIKLALLGAAVIAGSILVLGTQPGGIVGFYREVLSPMMFALWLAGFFTSALIPPTVAVAFWLSAKRSRYGWVFHILLVPVIFALVRGCVEIMLFAADEPDADGPTGWATDPAVVLMAICPIIYFFAVGASYIGSFRRSANGN
jgi:hypothetical protein